MCFWNIGSIYRNFNIPIDRKRIMILRKYNQCVIFNNIVINKKIAIILRIHQ